MNCGNQEETVGKTNRNKLKTIQAWARWHMPVIPALRRLRQENYEFKASWGCIARLCLKTNHKKNVLNFRTSGRKSSYRKPDSATRLIYGMEHWF
jgi:hypothetical protein